MATVSGFNKERSLQIENTTIVDGHVDTNGHLILETREGTEIDAGNVVGPAGDDAVVPSWVTRGYSTAEQNRFDPDNLFQSPYLQFGQDGVGLSNSVIYTGPEVSPVNARMAIIGSRDHVATYSATARPNEEFVIEVVAKRISGSAALNPRIAQFQSNGSNPTSVDPFSVTVIEATNVAQDLGNGWNRYRAKVKIRGDLSIGLVKARVEIDQVSPFGTEWVISNLTVRRLVRSDPGFVTLTPINNWGNYSSIMLDTIYVDKIGATKLDTGLVVMSGLLRSTAAVAFGEVIGVLPVGYRPEFDMVYPVMMGNATQSILIKANGEITSRKTIASGTYLSLEGISFWAIDSEAIWTNIGNGGSSWGANFESSSSWETQFGIPGFYVDRYGFTWTRGLARVKVATTVDNTNICILPAGARAHRSAHIFATGDDIYAGIGARPADGLNWKSNSPTLVGKFISLAGLMLTTTAALALNEWKEASTLINSWVNHHVTLDPTLGWCLRGDGLRVMKGLIKSGTAGAAPTTMAGYPDMVSPIHRRIMGTLSNNATARLDMIGKVDTGAANPMELKPQSGVNNTWWSFDSVRYIVY